MYGCFSAPWAWAQRSCHWGRVRPWQSSPARVAWPGCSHLGKGRESEESLILQTLPSVVQVVKPISSPCSNAPLTSPRQSSATQGFSPVPIPSGPPASSGSAPRLLSAPSLGMPGSAAALEVTGEAAWSRMTEQSLMPYAQGPHLKDATFKAATWTFLPSTSWSTSLTHTQFFSSLWPLSQAPGLTLHSAHLHVS